MRFKLKCFFLLSFFVFFPVIVNADELVAKQTLQNLMSNLRSMEFSESNQALDSSKIVSTNKLLDLEAMVEKSLEKSWDDASKEQQVQFMNVMWKLLEKIAYPQSKIFLGQLEIKYENPEKIDDGYEIMTLIEKEEDALDIEAVYLIHDTEGQWKIYDVILDGVSMTEDLAYQFETIIKESDFDGLLQRMDEKLAEVSKA